MHSQAQQKWARELISKLSLDGTENVLDIGCGDGKVTAELAHLLPKGAVIGVDNSSSMLALATEQYPASQYPNLSFILMDAAHLSFQGQFDVAFSNAALHWVKNHKPVLQGIYKGLKPNGKVLLQMGGKGNAEYILAVLNDLMQREEWKSYFDGFSFPYRFHGKEEYEQWLIKSGFKVNRVELIPKDMEHDGQSGLEGWIRTTWLPYMERVPTEKRNEFIRAISTEYINQVPMDSEGKVHVAMVRIEVEAEKPIAKYN